MLIAKGFNKRAIKCYEKCGFKFMGIRREAAIIGSQKYDEYYMDILASEFKRNYTAGIVEGLRSKNIDLQTEAADAAGYGGVK
jgi:hypothetical protein